MELYEYAVVRIVPRVEREEFVNAGVILFCKKPDYLGCKILLPREKMLCLHPQADLGIVQNNLAAMEEIVSGKKCGSPIASLEKPERFRWLTAYRSTIIQTSRVHPGMGNGPAEVLEKLFRDFVL